MKKSKKRHAGKEVFGTVVSDKMDKTIVVEVGRVTVHPIFKKTMRRRSKVKAHDEKNSAKTGDTVKLREARPVSKDKCWRLAGVIRKAE